MKRKEKIRLALVSGLIFFIAVCICCDTKRPDPRLLWKNEQAIGVAISKKTLDLQSDSSGNQFVIKLSGVNQPILGEYSLAEDEIIFSPLIPFTRGLTYEVTVAGNPMKTFVVPLRDTSAHPTVTGLYPTADTVPENLLKIHLVFSQPMQEGQSANNITLTSNNGDTVRNAFLDLQPELWDTTRRVLTVWLDPGRIKRGLHPNKLLGAPLRPNENYVLTVSSHWKDIHGSPLKNRYTKNIFVARRDSLIPDSKKWMVSAPAIGTIEPLRLNFNEMIDYVSLIKALAVSNGSTPVKGTWRCREKETVAEFTPSSTWQAGEYKLQIETRLEDLAGNNLKTPFERNLNQPSAPPQQEVTTFAFTIKPVQ